MSKFKKKMEKDKRRQQQKLREEKNREKREHVEMVQQLYDDNITIRKDIEIIDTLNDEIGIPRYPTMETLDDELEKIVDIVDKVPKIINNYIDDKIENDKTTLLNKVGQFFNHENIAYKYELLKDIAKQNLDNFYTIESILKTYLEDAEHYEYMFKQLEEEKDIEMGMVELVDNTLLDMGVELSQIEIDYMKKWEE